MTRGRVCVCVCACSHVVESVSHFFDVEQNTKNAEDANLW